MNKNLYYRIYKWENIFLAYRKARKGKTKKLYVLKFEKNLIENLQQLQFELMTQTYKPRPLINFVIRDPKTRKISKSDFRDRIIHHALVAILQPIFEPTFIYDSCANQIGKGNLFAIKRFDKFKRKVTSNLLTNAFCIKADIRHYFEEVNHEVLIQIIKRKISDEKIIWLLKQILENTPHYPPPQKGMPLGNLTSQFFANIYLNELDYFIKHKLEAKFYLRYVDDFLILHKSKAQLETWKVQIEDFLKQNLKLEIHPQKTKIVSLSRGIDFVGFRNFYYHRLLRKRSIRIMQHKINLFKQDLISYQDIKTIWQGWKAYTNLADTHKLVKKLIAFNLQS